jgi:hypothetical protein
LQISNLRIQNSQVLRFEICSLRLREA